MIPIVARVRCRHVRSAAACRWTTDRRIWDHEDSERYPYEREPYEREPPRCMRTWAAR